MCSSHSGLCGQVVVPWAEAAFGDGGNRLEGRLAKDAHVGAALFRFGIGQDNRTEERPRARYH